METTEGLTQAQIDAGRRDAETRRAVEISELCSLARFDAEAPALIRSSMTGEQVRRHLLDLQAQAEKMPKPGAASNQPPAGSSGALAAAYAMRGLRLS